MKMQRISERGAEGLLMVMWVVVRVMYSLLG